MPGFLLTAAGEVICAHGGQVKPVVPNSRVLVMGQPTVNAGPPWTVAGCANPPPPANTGPCVTAAWSNGTTRVLSNGMPLLIRTSLAECIPTGTPTTILVTQPRVSAE